MKSLTFAKPALAAICVPVILTSVYFSVAMVSSGQVDFEIVATAVLISFFVSAAHVIILGVPAILLLNKLGYIRWWAVTFVGFLAGCIPIAILMWPVDLAHRGGFSHWDGTKEVALRENGIPTMAGWMQYAGISLYFGAFGAVCGFVFWFVQKKTSRS